MWYVSFLGKFEITYNGVVADTSKIVGIRRQALAFLLLEDSTGEHKDFPLADKDQAANLRTALRNISAGDNKFSNTMYTEKYYNGGTYFPLIKMISTDVKLFQDKYNTILEINIMDDTVFLKELIGILYLYKGDFLETTSQAKADSQWARILRNDLQNKYKDVLEKIELKIPENHSQAKTIIQKAISSSYAEDVLREFWPWARENGYLEPEPIISEPQVDPVIPPVIVLQKPTEGGNLSPEAPTQNKPATELQDPQIVDKPITTKQEEETQPTRKASRQKIAIAALSGLLLVALLFFLFKYLSTPRHFPALEQYKREMIYVAAGEFTMGTKSADPDRKREGPPHTVFLDDYRIGKTEITVEIWSEFCRATQRTMPQYPAFNENWKLKNHPITNVSWEDAQAFSKWAKLSLPTEAQWEKAARSHDKRTFPWGNNWDENRCVNDINGESSTAPIGSKPSGVSPFGLLDMAGNVWEWCEDTYDETFYEGSPKNNPVNTKPGLYRVIRGGSWYTAIPSNFETTFRSGLKTNYWIPDIGFRCVNNSK